MRTPLAFLIVSVLATAATALTIHVPEDQPSIQAGIDASSAGDTVLVACGTYFESDIQMKSGVCLRSATGSADCVTIDAQGADRVIIVYNASESTRIEGLTITGGYCFTNTFKFGAGLVVTASWLQVSDCAFIANEVEGPYAGGGGVQVNYGVSTFTRCEFRGNLAHGGLGWSPGGGLSCGGPGCEITLVDCIFEDNSAGLVGAAFSAVEAASATLEHCVFVHNETMGCAILLFGEGDYAVSDCLFAGNNCGGVMCEAQSVSIANCTMVENAGPGIWQGTLPISVKMPTTLSVSRSLIARNQGEAVLRSGDLPFLDCCDLYGNIGGDWIGDIADQAGINGNFSADPQFCGIPGSGNYYLQSDSPCAPGHHPDGYDCGVIGVLPVGCGTTSAWQTSWSAVKSLF